MQIDIDTRFITLIGTPLDQSFAARMQNAAYQASGINACYFYTETDSEHLGEILNGIRHMPSFCGCAITKPNKVKVLDYLDDLDPLCRKMGAANTVVKTPDGRLIGYNTDGTGFYRSLTEETDVRVQETKFFCFGAGGASRAMCSALAYHGAPAIYITDIVEENSKALAQDINTYFAPVAECVPFGDFSRIGECGVIMNATGIGMGKTMGKSPLPEEDIVPGRLYYDACYNPDKTQFLLNAEKKGCKILNGLGMSLYQSLTQIKLWTGREAPIEVMRQELIQILREKAWTESHADSGVFGK